MRDARNGGGSMRFRVLLAFVILIYSCAGQAASAEQSPTSGSCPPITAANVAQLKPLQHIPSPQSVLEMQFSADNRSLITGQDVSGDKSAQRWDLATAQKRVDVQLDPSEEPDFLISPDGHYLAYSAANEHHVVQT